MALRLFRRVDMRNDDAQRSAVEAAGAQASSPADTRTMRRNARIQRRDTDRVGILDGRRSVLEVDEEPVIAGGFHQAGHFGRAQGPHAHADCNAALCQPFLDRIDDFSHFLIPVIAPPASTGPGRTVILCVPP